MNDVVERDLKHEITQLLLQGYDTKSICRGLHCAPVDVLSVSRSMEFMLLCKEETKKVLVISGLESVNKILETARLATSDGIRLKAYTWLADKALALDETQGIDGTASTMSQDQLARRLKELQKEANKRAVPIDTGVIDMDTDIDIDDMLG